MQQNYKDNYTVRLSYFLFFCTFFVPYAPRLRSRIWKENKAFYSSTYGIRSGLTPIPSGIIIIIKERSSGPSKVTKWGQPNTRKFWQF